MQEAHESLLGLGAEFSVGRPVKSRCGLGGYPVDAERENVSLPFALACFAVTVKDLVR